MTTESKENLPSYYDIDWGFEEASPAYMKLKDIVERNPVYWADIRVEARGDNPKILVGVRHPKRKSEYLHKLPEAYRQEGIFLEFFKRDLSEGGEF